MANNQLHNIFPIILEYFWEGVLKLLDLQFKAKYQ